ncbi:MAG: hypothetical protein M0Z94_13945 [Dehalococcoidales bacterium]|nr:hypothetical protein [Dehalococcoidales bacterium]
MMSTTELATVDLPGLLARAVPHARPEQLGHLILRFDPQFHRLSAEETRDVVQMALELGAEQAETVAAEQGTRDPFTVCEQLGVRVETSEESSRYGSILQYAEYRSRPPQVRLYRKAMEGANRLLTEPGVTEVMGMSDVSQAFLAHELFHHLDNLPEHLPAKQVHRVTTIKIGPWVLRSGLVTAPEVAAGSFAQTLLRLPFHPKLVDLLAIYAESPAKAAEWVRVLVESDDESKSGHEQSPISMQ